MGNGFNLAFDDLSGDFYLAPINDVSDAVSLKFEYATQLWSDIYLIARTGYRYYYACTINGKDMTIVAASGGMLWTAPLSKLKMFDDPPPTHKLVNRDIAFIGKVPVTFDLGVMFDSSSQRLYTVFQTVFQNRTKINRN